MTVRYEFIAFTAVDSQLSFWASDWDDDEIDWDEIDFMDVPESIFDLLLRYQSIMQQIHRRRMLHTYVEMDPVVRELITELEGQAKNLAAEIRTRAQALLPNEAPEEAVGSKHIEDVQPVEETVEEEPQEEEADIEEKPEQLLEDEAQRQIEEDEALIAAFKSGALNVRSETSTCDVRHVISCLLVANGSVTPIVGLYLEVGFDAV